MKANEKRWPGSAGKKWLPLPERLGVLAAGLSAVCAAFIYALPGPTLRLADYLTHSTMTFAVKPFDLTALAIGTIAWGILGWLAGLAWVKLSEF